MKKFYLDTLRFDQDLYVWCKNQKEFNSFVHILETMGCAREYQHIDYTVCPHGRAVRYRPRTNTMYFNTLVEFKKHSWALCVRNYSDYEWVTDRTNEMTVRIQDVL